MAIIPGYQVVEALYESTKSLIYRGWRDSDEIPVILKVLNQANPPLEAIARFKLEYDITRSFNLEGVVKAYGIEPYQHSLIMILEDFGGESLSKLMQNRKFTLEEFLTLATQITKCLGRIHQQNIMHKDVNPSNIVFNPATGQVKIIDFGIATVLSRENPTIRNPNVLEGTLAYMSPEQTGRMNRAMDYRTDFYSLGITFYQLLCVRGASLRHRLPFETTDVMELVHCHIAKHPISPHELNPEIPQAVSNLVMKLLAKNAEDRYQSSWGIQTDLQECLYQIQANGKIEVFPLGSQDISDKFQIPQKLYGREREVELLLAAFERVSQGAEKQQATSLQNSEFRIQNSEIQPSTFNLSLWKELVESSDWLVNYSRRQTN
ncbi:MAG: serine/threonine protein kinase [Microcystaceae cyanobacterium]